MKLVQKTREARASPYFAPHGVALVRNGTLPGNVTSSARMECRITGNPKI